MSPQTPAGQPTGNRSRRAPVAENGWDGLDGQSLTFVESLYADYLNNPDSVSSEWRKWFERLADGRRPQRVPAGPSFRRRSLFHPSPARDGAAPAAVLDWSPLQERVDLLIRNYRVRGHIVAAIDPLGQPRPEPPELDSAFYGFTEEDLDRPFSTTFARGPDVRTLRQIIQWLRNTYCRSIGVQFMHIDSLVVREWLQSRMEGSENRITLRRDEQLRILTRLTDAVIFEEFVQKKYLGAKSFSLEGAESLIPLLDLAIEKAGEDGVEEIVLGMAHRGRLNVLVNVMGKSARQVFREFEDRDPELHTGGGDVKYHLGHSSDWPTTIAGHRMHLSLCFNPSHLEFVNPVVLGRVRAKQDRFGDRERRRGMALIIHGDAAFAGEGIVQETLNLSELEGYRIGGTVHVVVNNQVGFTTAPSDGRSSVYATDVAKMLQVPIFHVNGEDPEAVAQVVRLAMDFRKMFQRDVFIDMYCYRRRGHNEGDEPSFTQPVMYRAIEQRKPVREGYLDHLLQLGGVTRDEADRIAEESRHHLETELETARSDNFVHRSEALGGIWRGYVGGPAEPRLECDTGVPAERLAELLDAQTRFPENFHPHPKIERGMRQRREMAAGKRPLDWAAAESLAFATLAVEGHRVRLSGQDVRRGTFSQRHAVLYDYENGRPYVPLMHLHPEQAPVEVFNSPLSEAGVLGFDYGYSLDCPDGLVLWEAQFGDFVNAAQVIVDQFIASAEDKWRRLSGIVLLLPHGFEGQGPEHSSARLERFLTLSAEDNIQVVYPTTPAQYFHVLRRQVVRPWRKPLVVMTPKSLLRHPQATSTLDDCAAGRFQPVIPDGRFRLPAGTSAGNQSSARRASRPSAPADRRSDVDRILLCAGKISYELEARRQDLKREDVALIRLEQFHPLPLTELREALSPYPDGVRAFWVQEEPENMGGWRFLRCHLGEALFDRLPFSGICRPASASPATGSATSHKIEQQELLAEAFGGI